MIKAVYMLGIIPAVVFAAKAFVPAQPKAETQYVQKVHAALVDPTIKRVRTTVIRPADLRPADDFLTRWAIEPTPQVVTAQRTPIPRSRPGTVEPLAPDERPVVTKRKHRVTPIHKPRDICARHNMRKEITRGGRSWRCRR